MPKPPFALPFAGALLAAMLLGACGASGTIRPATQHRTSPLARAGTGAPAHIAVVVMENEEYGDIIGQGQTPYINSLARRYGLADQTYAVSHPSLPNYLALTSGSTHGIASDCTDCTVSGGDLAGQLQARGISWKAYMEDLPHPCFLGAGAGDYAKKHDPFAYYKPLIASRAACERIVPLRQLASDIHAGRLPRFIWVTPNLCHDMHDCGAAVGDRFLASFLPPLLRALGPHGLLFLTWDEGTSDNGCSRLAAGGHIALIAAGGAARPHARLATPVDHYSLLQTVEDLFGLPRLGGAACACTPSLQPLLETPAGRSP
jgi:hypothetical protein